MKITQGVVWDKTLRGSYWVSTQKMVAIYLAI